MHHFRELEKPIPSYTSRFAFNGRVIGQSPANRGRADPDFFATCNRTSTTVAASCPLI